MSSALWLVEGRRNGLAALAVLVLSHTGPGTSTSQVRPLVLAPWASNYWGPNTSLISLVASVPLLAGPKSHYYPQEKKSARCCRFESHNDSEFIAWNPAFYRPKSLSIGQLHTTWLIRHFLCEISRPLIHAFLTLTISHILHNYQRVTRSVVPSHPRPIIPLYKYIISCITHRFLCPFVRSYLRTVVPSYGRTFVRSYLRTVVPSYGRTFVRSYLRTVVPSYGRTFVRSYLRTVVPSYCRTFVPS